MLIDILSSYFRSRPILYRISKFRAEMHLFCFTHEETSSEIKWFILISRATQFSLQVGGLSAHFNNAYKDYPFIKITGLFYSTRKNWRFWGVSFINVSLAWRLKTDILLSRKKIPRNNIKGGKGDQWCDDSLINGFA